MSSLDAFDARHASVANVTLTTIEPSDPTNGWGRWLEVVPVASWPAVEPEIPPTEHRIDGECHFVGRSDVGGAEFRIGSPDLRVHLATSIDHADLAHVIDVEWLPVIAAAWGDTVLHGGGATHRASKKCVAIVGESHAGKSTLSYAIGQRNGWAQIADDALALSSRRGRWTAEPLTNHPRLRRSAQAQFTNGKIDSVVASGAPTVAAVVLLEQRTDITGHVLEPTSPSKALPVLLAQSYLLEDNLETRAHHLRQLMQLLETTPVYRLQYAPDFSQLPNTIESIEKLVIDRS